MGPLALPSLEPSAAHEAGRRRLFLADLANRLPLLEEAVGRLTRAAAPVPELLEALRRQAHDIKGTGASFGVPAATDIARELEQEILAPDGVDLDEVRRAVERLRRLLLEETGRDESTDRRG